MNFQRPRAQFAFSGTTSFFCIITCPLFDNDYLKYFLINHRFIDLSQVRKSIKVSVEISMVVGAWWLVLCCGLSPFRARSFSLLCQNSKKKEGLSSAGRSAPFRMVVAERLLKLLSALSTKQGLSVLDVTSNRVSASCWFWLFHWRTKLAFETAVAVGCLFQSAPTHGHLSIDTSTQHWPSVVNAVEGSNALFAISISNRKPRLNLHKARKVSTKQIMARGRSHVTRLRRVTCCSKLLTLVAASDRFLIGVVAAKQTAVPPETNGIFLAGVLYMSFGRAPGKRSTWRKFGETYLKRTS